MRLLSRLGLVNLFLCVISQVEWKRMRYSVRSTGYSKVCPCAENYNTFIILNDRAESSEFLRYLVNRKKYYTFRVDIV